MYDSYGGEYMNNTTKIEVMLNKKEDMVNKFNNNILADDLAKYIYDECTGMPLNRKVTIKINSTEKLTDDEKNKLVDMIRENFGLDVKENMMYIKYDNIKDLFLFLIGVLLIVIANLITNTNFLWLHEVILIISWLAIWESSYNFVFEDTKRRIKIKRLRKLSTCKIVFDDEE